MNAETKNKVVLLTIDGLGFSPNSLGNAFLSSKPKNFIEIWNKYFHLNLNQQYILDHFDKSPILKQHIYSIVSTSNFGISEKQYIDQEIESRLNKNENISSAVEYCRRHSSAMHIIGNIGGADGRYGQTAHILALIKIARSFGVRSIFLHLILSDVDGDYPKLLTQIEELNNEIIPYGNVKISSICGIDNFLNGQKDTRLIFDLLTGVRNNKINRALTFEQALSRYVGGNIRPDLFPPTTILQNNEPISTINEFDSIFFSNYNVYPFSDIISQFLNNGFFKKPLPKFIKISSLFDPFSGNDQRLNFCFKQEFKNTLPEELKNFDKKQLYIYPESRLSYFKPYFYGQNNADGIDEIITKNSPLVRDFLFEPTEIKNQLVSSINKGDYDFIFATIPSVDKYQEVLSFENTVKSLLAVDSVLPEIERVVINNNVTFILTSFFGGAEKMSNRNRREAVNQLSDNNVPLIVISPKTKVQPGLSSSLGHNFFDVSLGLNKSRYSIIDLAPTVKNLLGLNIKQGENPININTK